jgi:hypothetical protein
LFLGKVELTIRSSHPARWVLGRCKGLYSTLYRFRLGVGGRSIAVSPGVAPGVAGREVSADPAPLLRFVYLRLAVCAGVAPAVEVVATTGTVDGSILIGGGIGFVLDARF